MKRLKFKVTDETARLWEVNIMPRLMPGATPDDALAWLIRNAQVLGKRIAPEPKPE